MAEEDKVICPVCDNRVGTKDDGTLIKAHRISGVKCEGSDQPAVNPEATPIGVGKGESYVLAESPESNDTDSQGIDKGESYEALDSAQGDEQTTDESTDAAALTPPETGTQGVASSEVATFVHTIKVAKPCPHLNDTAWNFQNARMAAKAAQKAGHVLAGGEAQVGTIEETDTHYLVGYVVPVK